MNGDKARGVADDDDDPGAGYSSGSNDDDDAVRKADKTGLMRGMATPSTSPATIEQIVTHVGEGIGRAALRDFVKIAEKVFLVPSFLPLNSLTSDPSVFDQITHSGLYHALKEQLLGCKDFLVMR